MSDRLTPELKLAPTRKVQVRASGRRTANSRRRNEKGGRPTVMKNAALATLLCVIAGLTLVWPPAPTAQAGQQPAGQGQGGGRGTAAGGRGGAMQHAKGT